MQFIDYIDPWKGKPQEEIVRAQDGMRREAAYLVIPFYAALLLSASAGFPNYAASPSMLALGCIGLVLDALLLWFHIRDALTYRWHTCDSSTSMRTMSMAFAAILMVAILADIILLILRFAFAVHV